MSVPSGFTPITKDDQWQVTFPDLDNIDAVSITYEFTGTFWTEMGYPKYGYSEPAVWQYSLPTSSLIEDHTGRWYAYDRDREMEVNIQFPIASEAWNPSTTGVYTLNTFTGYTNWQFTLHNDGTQSDNGPILGTSGSPGSWANTVGNGSTLHQIATLNSTSGYGPIQTWWTGQYKGTSTLAGLPNNAKYFDVYQVTDDSNRFYIYSYYFSYYDSSTNTNHPAGWQWCLLYEWKDTTLNPTNYFNIFPPGRLGLISTNLRSTESVVGPVTTLTRFNQLNQLLSPHKNGFQVYNLSGTFGSNASRWYLGYDNIAIPITDSNYGSLPNNRLILAERTNYASGLKVKATATLADGSQVVTTNAVVIRKPWYLQTPVTTFTIS
jgi:hypothetical protein